jgi:hypothetical protein
MNLETFYLLLFITGVLFFLVVILFWLAYQEQKEFDQALLEARQSIDELKQYFLL